LKEGSIKVAAVKYPKRFKLFDNGPSFVKSIKRVQ
jgi:hypothetical protein